MKTWHYITIGAALVAVWWFFIRQPAEAQEESSGGGGGGFFDTGAGRPNLTGTPRRRAPRGTRHDAGHTAGTGTARQQSTATTSRTSRSTATTRQTSANPRKSGQRRS